MSRSKEILRQFSFASFLYQDLFLTEKNNYGHFLPDFFCTKAVFFVFAGTRFIERDSGELIAKAH